MNLQKAIEIGQKLQHYPRRYDCPDGEDAIKLLIEAGKQIQQDRQGNPLLDGELLPGETEDA